MPPLLLRILPLVALLGWVSGCAHRPPAPATALSPSAGRPEQTASAARLAPPGTTVARMDPSTAFAPRLVVTTQVAHGDLFPYAFGPAGDRYVSVSHLHRGQRAHIIPFAINYGVSPDRRTDLTCELEIRRPDGSSDGPAISSVIWQGAVASPALVIYPRHTVTFHPLRADPLGDYVITAKVTDHLAGETVTLVHTLTVADYQPPSLPAGFDAVAWMRAYYQNPAPELALSALPALTLGRPSDRRASELPGVLGFYDQLLADNDWLLPAFCARLAVADPDEAYALSLVLGHHLRSAATPPEGVDFASWIRLADFRAYPWPGDTAAPLTRTAQLESLWGRFFASGLYAPVETILAALKNHADLGAAYRWQELQNAAGQPADLSPSALADESEPSDYSGAPPAEVRRDVLLRNALWSLRQQARQHTLIRAYLDWVARLDELPPAEAVLLRHVLAPDQTPPAQPASEVTELSSR
ncbi:MAG: hypothetical protein MUE42_09615 [Opitutaceae bacterium]|nr:hypothetical protein [Opitutaceae bacterium]